MLALLILLSIWSLLVVALGVVYMVAVVAQADF